MQIRIERFDGYRIRWITQERKFATFKEAVAFERTLKPKEFGERVEIEGDRDRKGCTVRRFVEHYGRGGLKEAKTLVGADPKNQVQISVF